MTVTTTRTIEEYVGDGSQKAWPITFPFFEGEDIKACIVNSAGEQVDLTYGTDYTVELSSGSIGGTLYYPLTDGVVLMIWLSLPITQETDFYNTGPLNTEVLETSLDRLTLIAQQLQEESDRSIKVATSANETPEELLADLYAGRDAAVASASAAATSEANAAASEFASATSQANAASSESAAASSAITAQAWAESETAPDPNDAESKSAKSWALAASDSVPIASTTYAGKVMASASLTVNQTTGEATVPVATESLLGIARQVTDGDGTAFAEIFRLSRIGVPVSVASTTLDDGFMWADGSLVLFDDYPELQEKYEAGELLVLSANSTADEQAALPLNFVANSAGTGLYLPRLSGLFARAWTGTDDGTVGGYNEAGLPNIVGEFAPTVVYEGLRTSNSSNWTGALAWGEAPSSGGVSGETYPTARGFKFNASLSSDLYGNANTVMPASYNQPYAIYLGRTA